MDWVDVFGLQFFQRFWLSVGITGWPNWKFDVPGFGLGNLKIRRLQYTGWSPMQKNHKTKNASFWS